MAADAAVHHVRGRDDVGAGFGMGERHLGQHLQGEVVVDVAVLDDAAVTVAGVFAEADVGDDEQLRHLFLEGGDRHLDDALLVVGAGAGFVLLRRDAEQQHPGDAQLPHLLGFLDQVVDRLLVAARHRFDTSTRLSSPWVTNMG